MVVLHGKLRVPGGRLVGGPGVGDAAKLEEDIVKGKVAAFCDGLFQGAVGHDGPLVDEFFGVVIGLLPVMGDDSNLIVKWGRGQRADPVNETVQYLDEAIVKLAETMHDLSVYGKGW